MSLIEDAHALIASGWPVFPCSSRKLPAISQEDGGHGFHDATLDTAAADRLFACQGAKLIGVPTGEASGFDVLDLDYKNGALEWEKANQYRLPETRIHRTMSGGRHYLFRHAPGVRNSASRISPGVDVRGEGGYIIAPPSPAYSVESDAEIAEWPDWLLEQILTRPPAQDQRPSPRPVLELSSKRLEGLTRSILSRVTAAVPGGKHFALRNAALSLGGIMDIAGIGESDAVERLLAALPEGVVDWNAARATALWGLQRGRERPLELPDRRPNGNGHAHPEPPDESHDPGWWHSLEQSLESGAEVAEVGPGSDEATSAEPMDGRIIDPTKDWLAAAPLREWIVDGWIPRGYVTGLYGDGGIGKSLIIQQLLTSVASSLPWLGLPTRGGRAFGFMCEDDSKELHRRQEAINRAMGLKMPNLENLRFASRYGFDNILMTFDQSNRGNPTELFAQLAKFLTDLPPGPRPTLIALDTLSDIFGGNEIMRSHARQFVQGIGGQLARQFNCGVVIAAHPSASGLSTGSGSGGSTAWSNTFRSRLYMTRPEEDDADEDIRHLSRMKANYAPKGGEIALRWIEGAFLPEGSAPAYVHRIEWDQIGQIFAEIERAWKEGDPWSAAPQTKKDGRYLPLWASVTFGLHERMVASYLDKWLAGGYLRSEIYDQRTKRRGLRVLRLLQPEVAAEVAAEV